MSSDKIQELVDKTFTLSKDYKHHYVTIEHLLAIIIDTEEIQDIFSDGPKVDVVSLKETLNKVAPFYSSTWDEITY